MYAKKEKIYPASLSNHNYKREKEVILLMISNEEKWLYFSVKKLSSLLWGITSTHHDDIYCLNRLHSFVTKKKTWIALKSIWK